MGHNSTSTTHTWFRTLVLCRCKYVSAIVPSAVLALLASLVNAAPSADPRMASVETGLLPVATTKVGVKANIEERLRDYGVPGLSIAVIEKGKIAWAKGYGIASTATGQKVTPTTLFQAASLSKPITAMGVLALVREKRLDLDEDVNSKLRGWKLPGNTHITTRMLLNHSSGLNVPGFKGYPVGGPLPDLIDILAGRSPANNPAVKPEVSPGESESYSGGGYEVLQQLIADVSRRPFDMYMQDAVLQPLGMSHSNFEQPLKDARRPVAAMGHYAGGKQIAGGFRVMPELAAAGLWSTPSDIAKYVINVQATDGERVDQPLTPALAREMLTAGVGAHGLGPTISGRGTSIRFGHDGFNEGYESVFVGYIHGDQGAVVMANSSFAFTLIEEVLNSISRAYAWPAFTFTSQRPPDDGITQQRVLPVAAHTLKSIIGDYTLEGEVTIRIFSIRTKLFLDWPGSGEAEIFATPEGRLFCPQLTFSDLGSPWLQPIENQTGAMNTILGAPGGSAKLVRVK